MGVINLGILIKNIMGKIAGAGYVKDDDYASDTKGGTIKVDSTYALDITSGGKLKAKEITYANFAAANDAAFISKKTLENILGAGGTGTWTYEDLGSVTQGTKKSFTDMSTALSCKKILIHNYTGDTVVGATMIDLELMRAALGTPFSNLTAIKDVIATVTSSTTVTLENDGLTVQGGGYIVIYFYQ